MHRSGSSALTHLLTSFGYYFGESDDGIGAGKENQKGFWERKDVRSVNDQILYGMKCEWDCISQFNFSALSPLEFNEYVNKASTVIQGLEKVQSNWVMKEPRVCLTYPIWKSALDEKPLIIYIHREPIEIANSLYHRNKLPINYGLDLWYRYSAFALNNINNHDVLFLSYSQLSLSPVETVSKIAQFLRLNSQEFVMPSNEQITSIIDPKLKHQKSSQPNQGLSECHIKLNSYIYNLISKNSTHNFDFDFDLEPSDILDSALCERSLFFDKYIEYKEKSRLINEFSTKLKSKRDCLTSDINILKESKSSLLNQNKTLSERAKHLNEELSELRWKSENPSYRSIVRDIGRYIKRKIAR